MVSAQEKDVGQEPESEMVGGLELVRGMAAEHRGVRARAWSKDQALRWAQADEVARVAVLAEALALVLRQDPGASLGPLRSRVEELAEALGQELREAAVRGRSWVPFELVEIVAAQEASTQDGHSGSADPERQSLAASSGYVGPL